MRTLSRSVTNAITTWRRKPIEAVEKSRAVKLLTNGIIGLIALLIWTGTSGSMAAGGVLKGEASWFSTEACQFNRDSRCPTASGASLYQLIRDGVPYAAMWDVPLHSQVEVCGRVGCQKVDILDRGPARKLNRLIDLNPDTFEAICGDLALGVCPVSVHPITP